MFKIQTYLFKGNSLKNKMAQGSIILASANLIEQTTRFLRNIILTRILAPEVFGLMAITLAISSFLDSFTEVGVKQSIIQNTKGKEIIFLNGAWWVSTIRAISLYLLSFFLAPLIAGFYNNPELIPLMRVAFLSILFRGMISVKVYAEIKQLRFKKWAIINNGGGIFGVIIAIILALYLKNVWALVLGFVAESAIRFLLSYMLCPLFPTLKFDRTTLNDLFKYTRGMIGLPILTFIFMHVDVFVLGKLSTNYNLGLYSMALALSYIPIRLVSMLISEILMPAFSGMQGNFEKINNTLFSITKLITNLTFPVLFFLVFYAKHILSIVYGPGYISVAVPFAIISITAILRLCMEPIVGIYLAIGKPAAHRYFTIIRAVMILALIYPAVKKFDMIGAASSGLIAMIFGLYLQVTKLKSITKVDLKKYFTNYLQGISISLTVILVWIFIKYSGSDNSVFNLFLGAMSCLISYLLSLMTHFRSRIYLYFTYHINNII
jgi:PST family polysaccharide transporter